MSYRFIRRISKGVAEVLTPSGHIIRLPYTGSPPKRGSIVQPQKDNCCCPQSLQFDSIPNRAIRTDPSPRRVSRRKGRIKPVYPIIYRGFSLYPDNFLYNPSLPTTYTVIFQPTVRDYPASKFPLYGIGVVISNVPEGPKIRGLTPVKFGKIVYQFEEESVGTSYYHYPLGFRNTTYYEGPGGVDYGFLSLYRYNARTGKVSSTGVTIEEYVKNHRVKYPVSDNFYFTEYYIADSLLGPIVNLEDWSNVSVIFNSIQPKTRFFVVGPILNTEFLTNLKHLEYVEVH